MPLLLLNMDKRDIGEVDLTIVRVKLENVLIDSGSTCNVIGYKIWDYLEQNHVRYESKASDKKLFAYGRRYPIDVVGIFMTEIICKANGAKCVHEFTVIKGNGKSILGKRTAERLKVLRDGTAEGTVNTVSEEGSDSNIWKEFADLFTGVRTA